MNPFVEQHHDEIANVLCCFDRVILTGTLPDICHAGAMASHLNYRGIRLFDYPQWAKPLCEEIRKNAEHTAAKAGIEIEFIRKLKTFRKEDRIQPTIRCFNNIRMKGNANDFLTTLRSTDRINPNQAVVSTNTNRSKPNATTT